MAGVEDRSEFDGGGVMPNTVYPKGSDALTPSDKLRLQSLTGQEEDSKAPLDPYHWHGNNYPDFTAEENDRAQRIRTQEARKRIEDQRYKETKRSQY